MASAKPKKSTKTKPKSKSKSAEPKTQKENFFRRTVEIVNTLGLHARPSARFVQVANEFPDCTIKVSNGIETVDGRSIMGIMTLAAAQGTELTLEIEGNDAGSALEALAQLIADKFNEE